MMPRSSSHMMRRAAASIALFGSVACAKADELQVFDRTVPPKLGPPPALTIPPVVERTLPNGLRVLVVEHHELPIVDVILLVRTGVEAEPVARSGLGTLAASLLDEGTTTRSALQIADQQAFLGVTLSTGSGWDASQVSLHTPTAQLDSALALMADVVLRPSFPPKELERLREERLTTLIQLRDRAPAIADRIYQSILFGSKHPYGQSSTGTEASVRAIVGEDVAQFHGTYYRPNNTSVIVVGDVTPEDIEQRLTRAFGAWERGVIPAQSYPETPAATQTTIHLVHKAGAPQSSFRIGAIGVPRSSPDYFPLLVANTLLGGTFTSRLMQNLRETRGFTYGASSSFDMRREAGPFTARAEIVAAKSDSALLEFMKELRAIRDTVPLTELEKAKQYLQLQLPGAFETTTGIANQLARLVTYDLPLDYFDTYSERIGKVTQADVQRVAQRYIDPARMAIVIVGDRGTVEPGLRATQVGKIELHDISGQPIRR
jgi:zinc protease